MGGTQDTLDLGAIDLERYDFDGLRSDITSLLDVQQAVASTLKWTLLLPLVGSLIAWAVFDDRMPRWVLVPYMLVFVAAAALAAVNIGLIFVLRNRIAETNSAADRVLEMTASLHNDYVRVQSGAASTSIGDIAGVLTRELVFPMLFAGGSSAVATATTAAGPLGWIGARLLKYPMQAVERRVLEVLESPELKDASDRARANQDDPIDGAGLVASALVPVPGEASNDVILDDWYAKAHEIVHRLVGGVGTVATGSLGTVLFFAAMPLIGWLAFGWYVL